MDKLLEKERQAKIYQYHRVTELEEEIKILKNTPLWKKLWNDIKPKRRCSYGYSRWYKWKEFLAKVVCVMIAVVFATSVFVGNYYLLKYARIWNKLH